MRMKKRGIMKKGLILGLSCMMLGSTITITRAAENTKPLTDFGNVLDVTADPKEKIYGTYSTNEYNNFTDMGVGMVTIYIKKQQQIYMGDLLDQ